MVLFQDTIFGQAMLFGFAHLPLQIRADILSARHLYSSPHMILALRFEALAGNNCRWR